MSRFKPNNQEIAQHLANSSAFLTDLAYVREYDTFYLWRGNYFKKMEQFELRKTIHLAIATNFPTTNITDSFLTDIIKSLRYYVNLAQDLPDYSRIAFNDRSYNLNTFSWEDHSKQTLSVLSLPYDSSLIDSPTPIWENFLKTSLVIEHTRIPDQELIDFSQEMFGYFLLPSLKGSSAFFLVGDGSNGKSVMVKVLEELFGQEFCSSMSIQSLTTDKFRTASLVGKVVNISNEEESKFIKADVLKALITGDTMTAERKFGDPFSFTPNTKFAFCTNEMPSFDTFNYGLKRRIKFIPFYRRFLDNEQDKELQEKLSQEIPGIIGWALIGARRFVANDRVFRQARASILKLEAFAEEMSSALTFFNEFYEISDDGRTPNCAIYDEYKRWCEANGRKYLNSNNFWKELKKEYGERFRDIWAIHFNGESNKRVMGKNIILKADWSGVQEQEQIEF